MTKQEFFAGGNEYFFFDDPKAVVAYCKNYWPEDCVHILRVADEVCSGFFLFDLKWDMERTWEPVIFDGEIDWGYQPGNDPEFIFQFNRHRFFICLGQAYQLTGDEKYAECFVRLLTGWIQTVKRTPETEKTMWRVLEAGIRGENWVKAIRYFADSPFLTDAVIELFYQSLLEHADFIVSMHSPYRYMSNWGVLENHGLFDIAMTLPDQQLKQHYAAIALEHLEIEARMQILRDGVQWEQSPMYHNEVFHCFQDVLILARRNRIEVPRTIREAVLRMAYANLAWKKPDHHQFLMGDSDDTDIRDYLAVAAWLYMDGVLKYGSYDRLDFESVWDLGIQAVADYQKIAEQEPDFTSVALADSGNYYFRSGWAEDANLLHFHCGTLGAGHGHSDKLHIDLVAYGEDILMDAGRYTYVAGPDRYEFKDPDNHNTITVDDRFFTVCKDSWECSKLSQPVRQQFTLLDGYEFVQGGHLGYLDQPNGVFVNRKILHIKPDFYLIVDEMYTAGKHSYQQYFHFNNQGHLAFDGSTAKYSGMKAEADFYFLTPGIRVEEKSTRISRYYNQAEDRKSLKISLEKEGFASLVTVIHTKRAGAEEQIKVSKIPVKSALKGIVYPPSMAESVKIKTAETEYIVVICHQEVNSPTDLVEADGCLGFGSVIVFDKAKDTKVGTVLVY